VKREDFGFVVSRGLAVWVAAEGLRALIVVPNIVMTIRESAKFPTGRSYSFLYGALIEQMMLVAGYAALGTLLLAKPHWFSRVQSQPEDEPATIDATTLRSALLSAVGLWLFIRSSSSLMAAAIEKREFSALVGTYPFKNYDWRGSAIEAVFGLAVFLGYTYGDSVARFLGNRGD